MQRKQPNPAWHQNPYRLAYFRLKRMHIGDTCELVDGSGVSATKSVAGDYIRFYLYLPGEKRKIHYTYTSVMIALINYYKLNEQASA